VSSHVAELGGELAENGTNQHSAGIGDTKPSNENDATYIELAIDLDLSAPIPFRHHINAPAPLVRTAGSVAPGRLESTPAHEEPILDTGLATSPGPPTTRRTGW
jgi:hypothetical protein